MNKIPFTVYDFFAYLLAGIVLVATIDYLYGYQWLFRDSIGPVLCIFLVFGSYVAGHCISHFSALIFENLFVGRLLKRPASMLLGENPRRFLSQLFPGYYKPLPKEVQSRIKKQAQSRGLKESGESLFLHAFGIVTQDEKSRNRLDEFRNLYGFARNMAFVCILSAILLWVCPFSFRKPPSVWWAIILGGLGVTMLYRYLKFYRQYTYQLLITYAELDIPLEKRSE